MAYYNGNAVDGFRIVIYPKGVDVIAWNGKVVPTDTSKLRLWAGNGSVADGYDFYYLESQPNEPSDWAKKEILEAKNLNLISEDIQLNYQEAMSREEFCTYASNLIVEKSQLSREKILERNGINDISNTPSFSDTQSEYVRFLAAINIISGYNDNVFGANDSITREQAAVILTRIAKFMTMQTPLSPRAFYDNSKIDDWAIDSVSFISACTDSENGYSVMGDTGSGNFEPYGTYTVEQSIISLKRLYNFIIFEPIEYAVVIEADTPWHNSANMIFYLLLQNSVEKNIKIDIDNIKYIIQGDDSTDVLSSINDIDNALSQFCSNATWRDITYFSFNGHGNEFGIGTHTKYYYEYQELYTMLNDISGQVVILLDACESGAFIDKYTWDNRFKLLTAAKIGNYTNANHKPDLLFDTGELISWDASKYTQFSYNLGMGIGWFDDKKYADTNGDNKISLDELFKYIDSNHGWNISGGIKDSTTPQVFPINDDSIIFAWD